MRRPKMNSVPVCVKCGAGQANDPIQASRRPVRYRGVGLTFEGKYSTEYLERTCPRCEFTWEEACEDDKG